jgi:hypothetical protein
MSYTFTWHFTVDFCSDSPYTNDVIGFDIYHHWKIKHPVPVEPQSLLLLRCEHRFVDEDFASLPFTKFRTPGKHLRIGTGRRARRFLMSRCGSGGNWHWTTTGCPNRVTPHLLNHLRRRFSSKIEITVWDGEFRHTIWNHPRSITFDTLRNFTRSAIRQYIAGEPDLLQALREHSASPSLNPQPSTLNAQP